MRFCIHHSISWFQFSIFRGGGSRKKLTYSRGVNQKEHGRTGRGMSKMGENRRTYFLNGPYAKTSLLKIGKSGNNAFITLTLYTNHLTNLFPICNISITYTILFLTDPNFVLFRFIHWFNAKYEAYLFGWIMHFSFLFSFIKNEEWLWRKDTSMSRTCGNPSLPMTCWRGKAIEKALHIPTTDNLGRVKRWTKLCDRWTQSSIQLQDTVNRQNSRQRKKEKREMEDNS